MTTFNISYEICGLIIAVVILFISHLQYETDSPRMRLFRRFVIAIALACFLDVVTALMINYRESVPFPLNIALNTIYFIVIGLTQFLGVQYFMADKDEFPRAWRYLNVGMVALYVALILVNLFTGWIFVINESGYIHGPLYMLIMAVPSYFLLNLPIVIIRNYKKMTIKEIFSYIGFIVVAIGSILIQTFLVPHILLTVFGLSLAALLMMFTLETPDFRELTRLQNNLQEEVEKQTVIATDRQRKLERMSIQVVDALVQSIDAKDEYTNGHSTRVAEYAELLARELGWNEQKVDEIKHAALLHDIGKIGIPDAILNKPGRLTKEEYNVMKQHTNIGADILANVTTVPRAMEVARFHHERFDGTGYPQGRKGYEIPETARVVCIADSYDAMSSKRVYRRNLNRNEIREELVRGRGTQFDPELLDVFLRMYDEDRLQIAHPAVVFTPRTLEIENAEYDLLTGILKRADGERAIVESISENDGVLVLLDLDNMKIVNAQSGYRTGDDVLKLLPRILAEVEPKMILCRFGGDEFLGFLPQAAPSQARESIRIAMHRFLQERSELASKVTVSAGLSRVSAGQSYREAFAQADKALYYVKRTGKNDQYFYGLNAPAEEIRSDEELKQLVEDFQKQSAAGVLERDDREFRRMMDYLMNMNRRYDQQFCVAMITLQADKSASSEDIELSVHTMESAIKNIVRNVDICTRYSNMQLLLVIQNVNEDNAKMILDRIFRKYYGESGATGITPTYAISMVNNEDKEPQARRRVNNEEEV